MRYFAWSPLPLAVPWPTCYLQLHVRRGTWPASFLHGVCRLSCAPPPARAPSPACFLLHVGWCRLYVVYRIRYVLPPGRGSWPTRVPYVACPPLHMVEARGLLTVRMLYVISRTLHGMCWTLNVACPFPPCSWRVACGLCRILYRVCCMLHITCSPIPVVCASCMPFVCMPHVV